MKNFRRGLNRLLNSAEKDSSVSGCDRFVVQLASSSGQLADIEEDPKKRNMTGKFLSGI